MKALGSGNVKAGIGLHSYQAYSVAVPGLEASQIGELFLSRFAPVYNLRMNLGFPKRRAPLLHF